MMDRLLSEAQKRYNRIANDGYGFTYSPGVVAVAQEFEEKGDYFMATVVKTVERCRDTKHEALKDALFEEELKNIENGVDSCCDSTATTIVADWEHEVVGYPRPPEEPITQEPEEDSEDTEDTEGLEVLGSLMPDPKRGLCESLFLMSGRSLPLLLSMD
jgi:hypothetical protein